MEIYIFDGSFNGILTAIFESYERKHREVKLVTRQYYIPDVFNEALLISSDSEKAKRVWAGLQTKASKSAIVDFYQAFLSEDAFTFQQLFDYALYLFNNPKGHFTNYGNDYVLGITQMSQKVHREKHRMEAFVRFQKSSSSLYYATINPDFNVLPLIVPHFTNRYADQTWVIYDERRKYGVFRDLDGSIHEVTFELKPPTSPEQSLTTVTIDEKEELYATLWKDYFHSTNIVERRNMKLHIQHVPKRYWRYLTEKSIAI
jgi:probable DNA metabolism protein